MGIYAEIKEQVTARDVAERYGYRVSRNGMMRCPFHDDKTPSMKIDRNFICFGCQEKGDVIRFTEKLFDLKPYDAAQKLIADFGLTVTVPESGSRSSRATGASEQGNPCGADGPQIQHGSKCGAGPGGLRTRYRTGRRLHVRASRRLHTNQ